MKLNVFISVVVLHVVIIAGLYLLSACSTNSAPTAQETRMDSTRSSEVSSDSRSTPTRPSETTESSTTLDPAFNNGSTANQGDAIHTPTRPEWENSPLNEFPEDEVLRSSDNYGTSQVSTSEYTVKKGDSLWNISKTNGCSLNDLLAANGLTKNSVIHPGMSLVIPGNAAMPSTPTSVSGVEAYVVVRGDTLSGIAKRFNTTISDIKIANGLKNNVIQLGQKLSIPINSSSGVSSSPSTTSSQSSTASRQLSDEGYVIHEVKPGEFPSKIARMYGLTTNQLMSDNGISDPRKMRAGQKLKIRLTGAAGAAAAAESAAVQPEVTEPIPTPTVFEEEAVDLDELDFDDIPEVEAIPGS